MTEQLPVTIWNNRALILERTDPAAPWGVPRLAIIGEVFTGPVLYGVYAGRYYTGQVARLDELAQPVLAWQYHLSREYVRQNWPHAILGGQADPLREFSRAVGKHLSLQTEPDTPTDRARVAQWHADRLNGSTRSLLSYFVAEPVK